MSTHAEKPPIASPPGMAALRDYARDATSDWWVFLGVGIAWLVASLVILQFDSASITTVSVIVGLMFLFAGASNITLAFTSDDYRWVGAIFGMLFFASAVICFVNPEDTFAGLADILGFLFLTVGIWWMIRAFLERPLNPTWWLGLISGILMTALSFWTAGQFFTTKAYIILVFAGIWALMEGITNIVRAFALRDVHKGLGPSES